MRLKYLIWGGVNEVWKYRIRSKQQLLIAPVTEWCRTEAERNAYKRDLVELNEKMEGDHIAVKLSAFNFDAEEAVDFFSPMLNERRNIWSFDAEESWTRDDYSYTISRLISLGGVNVVKCYQAYLDNSFERMTSDIGMFGDEYSIRLVRGAYLKLERDKGDGVVFDTKGETDEQFREMMKYLVLECNNPVMIATHNKEDIMWLKDKKEKYEEKLRERVQIGQLMGMVSAGDHVVQYAPYGPLIDAIPYLSRRAVENSSILRHIL